MLTPGDYSWLQMTPGDYLRLLVSLGDGRRRVGYRTSVVSYCDNYHEDRGWLRMALGDGRRLVRLRIYLKTLWDDSREDGLVETVRLRCMNIPAAKPMEIDGDISHKDGLLPAFRLRVKCHSEDRVGKVDVNL